MNNKITYSMNTFTGEHEIMYLRDVGALYYVHIIKKIEGAYGTQFIALVDGMTTAYALPTIKAFSESLTVGTYYKITYLGEHLFDNGYTKHEYDIQIISQAEYDSKAPDNFNDDKKY